MRIYHLYRKIWVAWQRRIFRRCLLASANCWTCSWTHLGHTSRSRCCGTSVVCSVKRRNFIRVLFGLPSHRRRRIWWCLGTDQGRFYDQFCYIFGHLDHFVYWPTFWIRCLIKTSNSNPPRKDLIPDQKTFLPISIVKLLLQSSLLSRKSPKKNSQEIEIVQEMK